MSLWHSPTPGSPTAVDFVLVSHAAVGARGVGPCAVAQHPCRCPQGLGHEAAQQQRVQLGGGSPQRRAAGRATRPVPQPPKVTGRHASSWHDERQ